jgi:hypothetical protein
VFYIYIHIRSVFCPVLYLSKFRKEFRIQAFCTLDLKRSGSHRFRSDFDPENPIREYTSSRRHLILFLYTVSALWFAYGYVRYRKYTPGFTNSIRTDRTFTFSHLNVRTYDLTPCPYARSWLVAMSWRHWRCPCASKKPSIQRGTYVLAISCGAVTLVTIELPYLGCTSVPRRLPQDSDTAGSILLSQPVGLGSGLG